MSISERLTFQSIKFAANASLSLFRLNLLVDRYKPVYRAIAQTEQKEPLNRDEELLPNFLRIISNRNLVLNNVFHPYWAPDGTYDPLEVFGTIVQVMDYHKQFLPTMILPPEIDVYSYINRVMNRDGKVTISQQFEELLDISGNNIIGAANLGFMASRVMARGLDTRAYPHINVGRDEMLAWNNKIAQFETYGSVNGNDGPGDTYYFWTHMFGALFYKLYSGIGKKAYNFTVEHGTEIMSFVRNRIAGSPINSAHYEATLLGRNIGLALAESVPINETVTTTSVEKFLEAHTRIVQSLDFLFPEAVKATVRKYLRHENFPMEKPYTKKLHGLQANFWIRNASDWHVIVQEGFEGNFPNVLFSSIQPGMVFLDVGSAQGFYSLMAAKAGAEVFALEPDPITFQSFTDNLKLNPEIKDKVHVLNIALGDKSGILPLNVDVRGIYAPSFRRTVRGLTQKVSVQVKSLDELLAENKLKIPDVVKIDIEGAEGMALIGMKELLSSKHKPQHLFIEIHKLFLPKFGTSSQDILEKIAEMDYISCEGITKCQGKQLYHFIPL